VYAAARSSKRCLQVDDGNARGKCGEAYSQSNSIVKFHAAESPPQPALPGAHRKLCAARREQKQVCVNGF
jgi:hypothetical protein